MDIAGEEKNRFIYFTERIVVLDKHVLYWGVNMCREELEQYLVETYGSQAEFPWVKYPNFTVFRHSSNKKWFALMMDVSREKLGLSEDGVVDVVNVKCDPILIGSLRAEPGIYPAYHMSKTSWISVALDGSVSDDKIKVLLDMSYGLTALNAKQHKMPPEF